MTDWTLRGHGSLPTRLIVYVSACRDPCEKASKTMRMTRLHGPAGLAISVLECDNRQCRCLVRSDNTAGGHRSACCRTASCLHHRAQQALLAAIRYHRRSIGTMLGYFTKVCLPNNQSNRPCAQANAHGECCRRRDVHATDCPAAIGVHPVRNGRGHCRSPAPPAVGVLLTPSRRCRSVRPCAEKECSKVSSSHSCLALVSSEQQHLQQHTPQ